MCGVTGFWQEPGEDAQVLRCRVGAMADELRHRGPDGAGGWCDPECGVALGHRRLAVLDLSEAGAQPMSSADGRFVLSYNGEVYNHLDLRRGLAAAGARFRGSSDTESLLEAIRVWGLDETLPRLVGMFAFALWDRRRLRLSLVRDRLGIKPLYWGLSRGALLFGSELKGLAHHPSFEACIDRDALAQFLRHGYVPDPQCIYRGFSKLAPGTVATFDGIGEPRLKTWWSARGLARRSAAEPWDSGPENFTAELDRRLRTSVRQRLVSDVPVGAFLSGGIDSSLVAGLMQAQVGERIRTFTIGFIDPLFDEGNEARRVARHLGTRHTERRIGEADALGVIRDVAGCWDEPFADSSQIPTLLLARIAREHVTVALSGDGGDELFGGYPRYRAAMKWARLLRIPGGVRHVVASLLKAMPADALTSRSHRLARLIGSSSDQELYRRLVSIWPNATSVVPGSVDRQAPYDDRTLASDVASLGGRMMLLDTLAYLPGDILTKVDRASMSVGLEVRVPLLDHRVVELAWRLPPAGRISSGKRALREVLDKYLPRGWFERPKRGFGVPLGRWLRGSLREWAESLLDPRVLRDDGLLDPALIRAAWRDHLAGGATHHRRLWCVLTFLAWRRSVARRAAAAVPESRR